MNLIKPPEIKKGDVAYIISPSAGIMPFVKNRVERAKNNLERLGLKVKIAPNADKNSGYVSATIQERVNDIHRAFSDKDCSLIVAAIGGNHSSQLITELDYELIKNNPKTFIGYSDNTVLHLALFSQTSLQTFYGPCFLNQFGEFPEVLPYTLEEFKDVVIKKNYKRRVSPSQEYTDEILDWFKNEDESRARKLGQNSGFSWWREGQANGWALPAAIPSINHVLPTRYMPDVDGAILMIDIPEGNSMYEGLSVADVDAWLTDLANAGMLQKINGLIIGRPYKYSAEMIDQLNGVINRLVADLNIPVLFNADFGHTDPMISIPVGANILLDSQMDLFEFI